MMINTWLIPITGFRQTLEHPTGLERLWRKRLRPVSAPGVCVVTPRAWDDDFEAFARFVIRSSAPAPDRVRIGVFAYSWGAGRGFIKLAEALDNLTKRLRINEAVLADPVYRSDVLPTWLPLNVLSLLRTPRIHVPASVDSVWWTRQTRNTPRAHEPVNARSNFTTIIHPPVEVDLRHESMDEADDFWRMASEAAERLAK